MTAEVQFAILAAAGVVCLGFPWLLVVVSRYILEHGDQRDPLEAAEAVVPGLAERRLADLGVDVQVPTNEYEVEIRDTMRDLAAHRQDDTTPDP